LNHRPRPSARRAAALATSAVVLAGLSAPLLAGPAQAALAVPSAPVLSASSLLGPKAVQLRWAPVTGAERYVVQVGQDDEWSDDPTLSLGTVSTAIDLPVGLPHADYTWRVAAVQGGAQGPWSANGTTFTRSWLTTPSLVGPLGPQGDWPTFSWTPVDGASEYQVQVSSLPFGTPSTQYQADDFTSSCLTTRTTVTPYTGQKSSNNAGAGDCDFTGLVSPTDVHWRVRALDAVADEVAEVDTAPVVDEGISTQPPAPPGELDTGACPEERPAGALSCEPSNEVEKGGWSAPGTFTFALPGTPATALADLQVVETLPLPAGLCVSEVCTDVPTISWARPSISGTSPSSYRVYIALDAAFSNIQEVVETRGTSYTPTAEYRVSGVGPAYYYAVQACAVDGCGPVPAPADVTSFRKKSVAVTGLLSARTAQENRLTWQSLGKALEVKTGLTVKADQGRVGWSDAAAYRVQVTKASDAAFATPLEDVTVDGTSFVSRTTRLGDGDFLWRVQAVDASGHKLPWSAPAALRRDFTGPVPVTASTTVTNVNPSARLSIAFSENVVGASTGTVALVKSGAVVPATVTSSGKVVYLQPTSPLLPGATYAFVTGPGLTDQSGNAAQRYARTVKTSLALDDAHPAIGYTGAWGIAGSTAATGAKFHATMVRGSQAVYRFNGVSTAIRGCKSPSSGRYELWVDGVKRVTADAYQSFSGCGTLASVSGLARGEHVVQVKALGTKRAASTGVTVGFDGFSVTP
jgi:hypothetical protein